MTQQKWTAADLPALTGRTVVVTGASSGLGLITARQLAGAGARVVLAVRDEAKGRSAAATMPGTTEVRSLDLSSQASVRAFAAAWTGPLDIRVVTGLVERLEGAGGKLAGVRMQDGPVIARTVMVVAPRMVARSQVLGSLGLHPVPHPLGREVGELIESDPNGRTAVPGVWVAGNVTDIQAQVVTAAAQGLAAAAVINADLIAEENRQAVADARVRNEHVR